MRMSNSREGFALPAAILVVGILSISIAAGFTLVNSERRGVDDQQDLAGVVGQRVCAAVDTSQGDVGNIGGHSIVLLYSV